MPIKLLFFLSMITGTLISISASSWLLAWVGLEVNLASFIPLMMSPTNKLPNEAALKYFLAQTIASAFLMLNILTIPFPQEWLSLNFPLASSSILLIALLLKLGAAPFHFWYPPTMEGLTWLNCILLSTVQKIAPLVLISSLVSPLLPCLALTSALIGALGGYNQLSLRKLMAYSSIGHMGWLLTIIHFSLPLLALYLITYIYLTTLVMQNFMQKNVFSLPQILTQPHDKSTFITTLNILSLGGLPPFLGLLPKWAVIQDLTGFYTILAPAILIMSSLITLFFYLRMTYSFTTNFAPPKMMTASAAPNINIIWSIPSMAGLPLALSFFLS